MPEFGSGMKLEKSIGKLHVRVSQFVPEDIPLLSKLFHVCIDLIDEPGAPSGLYMHFCGLCVEVYYPTHIHFEFLWDLDSLRIW